MLIGCCFYVLCLFARQSAQCRQLSPHNTMPREVFPRWVCESGARGWPDGVTVRLGLPADARDHLFLGRGCPLKLGAHSVRAGQRTRPARPWVLARRSRLLSALGVPYGRAGARTATYIMCCAARETFGDRRPGGPKLWVDPSLGSNVCGSPVW